MKLQTGMWEGKYLDAYGYRGSLEFEVDAKGEQLGGKYKLVIAKPDRSQIITGPVSGNYKDDSVQLRLTLGKSSEVVEFSARVSDASTYAGQCMYGLLRTPPRSELGGGVWIAWHYIKRT